jgi:hypothetical protein
LAGAVMRRGNGRHRVVPLDCRRHGAPWEVFIGGHGQREHAPASGIDDSKTNVMANIYVFMDGANLYSWTLQAQGFCNPAAFA